MGMLIPVFLFWRKIMKKLYIIVPVICIMMFTSCGGKKIEGEELIVNARRKCAEFDSATLLLTDEENDEVQQSFSYMYNKDGSMTYLFFSVTDGNEYLEYNDGRELSVLKDGEMTQTPENDINFVGFSRDSPHPNAGEGLVLFNKDLITKSSRLDGENQTVITHEYNVKKFKKVNKELGEVKKFMIMYYFSNDGELNFYTENTQINRNGAISENTYKVDILETDMIKKIEKPEAFKG